MTNRSRYVMTCLICFFILFGCLCGCLSGCTEHPADTVTGEAGREAVSSVGQMLEALVDREDAQAEYIDSIRTYEVRYPDTKIQTGWGSEYGMSDGCCYIMTFDSQRNEVLHRIDAEGTVHTVPIPEIDGREAKHAVLLPDGSLIVVYSSEPYTDGFVCRYDSAGTLIAECALPDNLNLRSTNGYDAEIEENPDGTYRIYLHLYTVIVVFDEQLQLLHTVELMDNAVPRLYKINGRYHVGDYNDILYEIDFAAGTLTETDQNPLPSELFLQHLYYDADGRAYYDSALGFFRVEENGAATTVAEWLRGPATNVNVLDIADGSTVYAKLGTLMDDARELVIIDCTKEQALPERRRVIRVGYLGVGLHSILEQAISAFNQENSTYYIELVSYSGTGDSRLTALEEDLLAGKQPDMLFYSGYSDLDSLYNKGVLVDLLPFYGDRLLGGVKNAMMQDGHLWGVPFTMTVSTYSALASVADGPLTPEAFYALTEGLSGKGDTPEFSAEDAEPQYQIVMVGGQMMLQQVYPSSNDDMPFPGEVITGSHDSIRYIYENGLYDFVDYENKTASFDSPQFCAFIENLKRIDEEFVHKNAGNFTGSGNFRYSTSSAYTRDNLLFGNLKLLHTYIGDVGAYAALKHLYGDNAFTLCGYPSARGCGARISTGSRMAIFADSAVHGGCREFLDYMLSEQVQNSDVIVTSSLPVTKDALSRAIDEHRYYYYPSDGELQLEAVDVSAEHLDIYDEALEKGRYTEIVITDEDKAAMMEFFDVCRMETGFDPVVRQIVEEELSFWNGGARTLEETAKIIQSRVWIYLNE
ncbi:MAG: carbohydrate ABC transporter substrate-binding protein [Clostridia bacterium]|nr:carbohydrate ABC transporter substrate-binding protein [Clostridia bacterium]